MQGTYMSSYKDCTSKQITCIAAKIGKTYFNEWTVEADGLLFKMFQSRKLLNKWF